MKEKDKIKAQLKKDLKVFNKDWKKLLKDQKLKKDKKYVTKIAFDIKNLNNDLILTKHKYNSDQISHMLTTPMGAPFVSDKTLLDAALNFENQSFEKSDLKHLITDLCKYEKYFDDEFFEIFNSFLKKLN
jgi:hypothetical protein